MMRRVLPLALEQASAPGLTKTNNNSLGLINKKHFIFLLQGRGGGEVQMKKLNKEEKQEIVEGGRSKPVGWLDS